MTTSPVTCSSVNGSGGTFVLVNNASMWLENASNNGGSYFKHITAANGYITSSETIYFASVAPGQQTGCQQLETMNGNDLWYCQFEADSVFLQSSATGSIAPGDTQIVGSVTGTEPGNLQVVITSYPSGTNVATISM